MNAHSHVEVLLGGAQLNGDRVALRDLAGVRAGHVKSDDAHFVEFVADELGVAYIVWFVRYGPLERPIFGVVDLDVRLAELLLCLFFRVADRAVFDGREYCRWHGVVVHLKLHSSS